jgi:hypothetical protein
MFGFLASVTCRVAVIELWVGVRISVSHFTLAHSHHENTTEDCWNVLCYGTVCSTLSLVVSGRTTRLSYCSPGSQSKNFCRYGR